MANAPSQTKPKPNGDNSTHEFHIAGAGTDIALLVRTAGGARIATVRRPILAGLRCVAGTRRLRRARTGRLRASGALQRRRHDLRRQVQVGAQILDAIVGQVPARIANAEAVS